MAGDRLYAGPNAERSPMTRPNSHLRLGPYADGRNFLGISEKPEGDMSDAEILADVRKFSVRCEDSDDAGGWVWGHVRGLIAEARYRGLLAGSALCLAGFHAPPEGGCHCMRCGKGPKWMSEPSRPLRATI